MKSEQSTLENADYNIITDNVQYLSVGESKCLIDFIAHSAPKDLRCVRKLHNIAVQATAMAYMSAFTWAVPCMSHKRSHVDMLVFGVQDRRVGRPQGRVANALQ